MPEGPGDEEHPECAASACGAARAAPAVQIACSLILLNACASLMPAKYGGDLMKYVGKQRSARAERRSDGCACNGLRVS
jgi:hypothetical protein